MGEAARKRGPAAREPKMPAKRGAQKRSKSGAAKSSREDARGARPDEKARNARHARAKAKPAPVPPIERPGNVRRRPPPKRIEEPADVPKRPLRERFAFVTTRAQAVAARLRKPAIAAFKALVVVAVIAGSVALGRLVERHVRTSPAFAIKTIDLEGTERLTRDEVLEAAGVAIGKNAFDTSPEDARARLLAHPWIGSAEVRRRLPDTFEIRIRERRPAAVLSLGALYLVSEDGTVFKRAGEADPIDLPVITGVDRRRFVSDEAWRTSVLLEVVALLHDYANVGLAAREPVNEVHVESDDGLSLYVGRDATFIRLGRAPFRDKLRRLRRVLDRLQAKRARAAYVYLDNVRRPDRVTVRLR